MTYAAAVAGRARPPPKPIPTDLGVPRSQALALKGPVVVTLTQIAVALHQQFPNLAEKIQPDEIEGQKILQCHHDLPLPEIEGLLRKGLSIEDVDFTVSKLRNIADPRLITVRVPHMTADAHGIGLAVTAFKEQFKCELLDQHVERYPGTRVATGAVQFLLQRDTAESPVPAQNIVLERDGHTEAIKVDVLTRIRCCFYCRETDHVRSACQKAPPCAKCGQRSHHSRKCTVVVATVPAANAPAAAAPAIALAQRAAAVAIPATPAHRTDATRVFQSPSPGKRQRTDDERIASSSARFVFNLPSALPGASGVAQPNEASSSTAQPAPAAKTATRVPSASTSTPAKTAPAAIATASAATATDKGKGKAKTPRTLRSSSSVSDVARYSTPEDILNDSLMAGDSPADALMTEEDA